jgi:hypothetical protein
MLKEQNLDAVIMAAADENVVVDFAPILIENPELAIIRADLSTKQMQVITNQSIDARISDLLSAIADLPKRKMVDDGKVLNEKKTNNGGESYEN